MNLEEFNNLARDHVKRRYGFDVENVCCTIILADRSGLYRTRDIWRQDDVGVDLEQIIEIVFDWYAIKEELSEASLGKALDRLEEQIEEDLTESIKENVL